ncbi:MAG: hypothetical protein ACXWQO_00525 [Bdellovibrionota bacterium]
MKMLLILLVLSFIPVWAAEDVPFPLYRYFKIKTCTKEGKCSEFLSKGLATREIELKMTHSHSKGINGGSDGRDLNRIIENGIPFKSEIHIIRYKQPAKIAYYVYLMLRSGPGTKRHGKLKTFSMQDMSEFKEVTLTDDPIPFKGGTLQAQLVVGPQLQ